MRLKRFFSIVVLVLLLLLLLLLPNFFTPNPAPEGLPLNLGVTIHAENAEFSLSRISTGVNVLPSAAPLCFYTASQGQTFVDLTLNYTYTGSESVRSDHLISAKAIHPRGTEYTNVIYLLETRNGTSLSEYEMVEPGSSLRLHCAIVIPKKEGRLTLLLNVEGTNYIYDYTLGETARNSTPLSTGEALTDATGEALLFLGTEYTNNPRPSMAESSYNEYCLEDSAETYLDLRFAITNQSEVAIPADQYLSARVLFQDGRTYYECRCLLERADGTAFDSSLSVAPGECRTLHGLLKMPLVASTSEAELCLFFTGAEYTYPIPAS